MLTPKETEVMAHRYLYYVKNQPVLSDRDYDKLEKAVIAAGLSKNSPLHNPGSDLKQDYPPGVISRASTLLGE